MMDVIFLSSGEWNAEENYQVACSIFGFSIKRVEDAVTVADGYKKAADLSESELFVLIDGDNRVFKELPQVVFECVTPSIFQAENFLGMRYGHGGVKVLSKSFEWLQLKENYLDIATQLNLEARTECLSLHQFEWSEFSRYKTIFKELMKLYLRAENFEENKRLLAQWLECIECRVIFDHVKSFLAGSSFNDLSNENINVFIKDSFLAQYEFVLLAILGDDKKWLGSFKKNLQYFDKSFILDTGSKDGSWQKIKEMAAGSPNLIVERKRFFRKDFSKFRNTCLKKAIKAWALKKRILFLHLDMDEELFSFDKDNLKEELLFNSQMGARFEVIRNEWHGAETPIPRIFFNEPGAWTGPIHETFWYEDFRKNHLVRVNSIRINHFPSPQKELIRKGERDLKILKRCLKKEPQRYLYFLFESLDKKKSYEQIIAEFVYWRDFVDQNLDRHFQLLIYKYVIHSYGVLRKNIPEDLIHFMTQFESHSVYYQLIKALMIHPDYRELCKSLMEKVNGFERQNKKDDLIYLEEAQSEQSWQNLKIQLQQS